MPQKKTGVEKAGFHGGEAEIRTLEPCYGLHDFQSCALDQLGDFSKKYISRANRSVYFIKEKPLCQYLKLIFFYFFDFPFKAVLSDA